MIVILHVVVELDKFRKTLEQIETDLDKLLYTMKLTDTGTSDATLPSFMKEDWLEETLKELDKANLTPEQRAELEMTIAGNMTEKEALEIEVKKKAIRNLQKMGILSIDQIAEAQEASKEFVKSISEKINGK